MGDYPRYVKSSLIEAWLLFIFMKVRKINFIILEKFILNVWSYTFLKYNNY